MRIQGDAAGLKLNDLILTDALKTPLVLTNVTTPGDRSVVVDQVRCLTIRDYGKGSEVVLPTAIQLTGAGASTINVRRCRIEGFQSGYRRHRRRKIRNFMREKSLLKKRKRYIDRQTRGKTFSRRKI